MPRRNRNAHARRYEANAATLQHLAGKPATAPVALLTERPCVVCGESLPASWRFPEHARCLNRNKETAA